MPLWPRSLMAKPREGDSALWYCWYHTFPTQQFCVVWFLMLWTKIQHKLEKCNHLFCHVEVIAHYLCNGPFSDVDHELNSDDKSFDPTNSLLGIYLKEMIQTRRCVDEKHPFQFCVIYDSTNGWKQTKIFSKRIMVRFNI